jgi:hypothetical protein
MEQTTTKSKPGLAGDGPVEYQRADVAMGLVPAGDKSVTTFDVAERAGAMQAYAETRRQVLGVLMGQVASKHHLVSMGRKVYLEGAGMMAIAKTLGWPKRNMTQQWSNQDRMGDDGQLTTERVCTTEFDVFDSEGRLIGHAKGGRGYDRICKVQRHVEKASEKNAWHHFSVEHVAELGNDDLKALGVDPGTVVGYEAGSKGGKHGGTNSAGVACAPNFGRDKGKPLSELDVKGLEWYVACLRRDIEDQGKQNFRPRNEASLAAIELELRSRDGSGGQMAPAPQRQTPPVDRRPEPPPYDDMAF